jgi:hypothetical protein
LVSVLVSVGVTAPAFQRHIKIVSADSACAYVPRRAETFALRQHDQAPVRRDLSGRRGRGFKSRHPDHVRCLGTWCTGVLGHRSRFGLWLVVPVGVEDELADEPTSTSSRKERPAGREVGRLFVPLIWSSRVGLRSP